MNPTIEISFKTAQAYSSMCKPLCQELRLPQTAFDILMFLANNPDCTTENVRFLGETAKAGQLAGCPAWCVVVIF